MNNSNKLQNLLKHHVTGAIERGEKEAIVAVVKPKHTPGPWTVYETPKSYIIETENVHHSELAVIDKQSASDVALNARLMAAAPELLEALRVTYLRFCEGHIALNDEDVALITSALDKARGEL